MRKPFKTRPDIDPNEIFRQDKALKNQTIAGVSGYTVGIPALNKIDITLPKGKGGIIRKRMEHHLLALDFCYFRFLRTVAHPAFVILMPIYF